MAQDFFILEQELETFAAMLPDISSPVLDAGCATGRDSTVLALKGLQVVGVDISAEAIQQAKQSNPAMDFLQMDVRHLEFGSETFGGVWCNATLAYLDDQGLRIALQEIYRVLKPGGVLAVSLKEGPGKSMLEVQALLQQYHFGLRQSYLLNEQKRFGPGRPDTNWIYCFAVKA